MALMAAWYGMHSLARSVVRTTAQTCTRRTTDEYLGTFQPTSYGHVT
eukprot:COSAG01_NODE_10820_length_2073_cov_168.515704_3_plen_47_part_00